MIKQCMLWQQVAAFRFDDSQSALTLTQRLARENGWSPAFAARVMEEYRRFVYLAVRAGHPVTPSEEVDQAWHLHMIYTRSYWDDLCRDVLGQPLHHGPTRGGQAEADKFHDWYEATLASYRRLFGKEPPPDIWPHSSVRFSTKAWFRRVDASKVWLIPKATVRRALALATIVMGLGVLLMACGAPAHGGGGDGNALPVLLMFLLFVCIVVAGCNNSGGPKGRGKDGGGCSSFSAGGCSSGDSGAGHSGGSHSGCGGHSGCGASSCGSGCGSGCGGGGCGGGD